ncbi:ATP-binding protein [Desulfacinum hydrothermale]|uniref:ATP-binding protein n=1 Tax=Desulfacinum hydrothermale TaxID=109258 RepID=UPI003CCBB5A6
MVWGDRSWFLHAVVNRVDNAVRFSPPRADLLVGVNRGNDGATLFVEDSAPSIPPEERGKIFERFN